MAKAKKQASPKPKTKKELLIGTSNEADFVIGVKLLKKESEAKKAIDLLNKNSSNKVSFKVKKKGKYDITVKTDLTADQLFKKAINTPIKRKK